MTDQAVAQTVLFFSSPDEIDLSAAADRFVELAASFGADPDSAQMVGPMDLVIRGPGVQIALSICDAPLATEEFLSASRPGDAAIEEDEVFTAIALHEASLVLRIELADGDQVEAVARLTACLIGRMPVAAVYCSDAKTVYAAGEFLDLRLADHSVSPRRIRPQTHYRAIARSGAPAFASAAAPLPDIAESVEALSAAMTEVQADAARAQRTFLDDPQPEPDDSPSRFSVIARRVTKLPLANIFSQRLRAS